MRVRFGEFELDTGRRELSRDGAPIPLAPKLYALLLLLVEERHRLVPFEEVMARIWPDVHVSNATLSSTLRDLRRATGDDGYHPHIVATARGQGLRFLGTLEPLDGPVRPDPDRLFGSRERLAAQLCSMFDGAQGGRGHIALVAGQAGMGKSRLGREVSEQARARGLTVQVGRCGDSVLDPPYGAWVQILTGLVEQRSAEIDAALEGVSAELARIVPAIADRIPDAAIVPGPDGDFEARYRLFDRVATFVRRLARATPILFVLDDFDRAARSSLEVLEFMASWVAEVPLFVVATYRPAALGGDAALVRTIAEIGRLAPCERYQLEALTRDEVGEYLRRCAGVEPSAQACIELHERSGGNPFFLRELVRHELGRAGGPGVEVAGARAGELPPSLREAIRARVLALSETAQHVLAGAALLGREFALELAASVADLPAPAVLETLAEAHRAGLVEPGDGDRWRFAHALILESIAEDVTPMLRLRLHERIGQVLRADARDDAARAMEVAHHLSRAAERVAHQAAEAAMRAAQLAERSLAFADAASFYETALELRARAPAGDPLERCELLLGLAQARLAARDVQGAWESARSAAELAREIASPVHLARAGLVLSAHFRIGFAEPLALLEEALPALPAEVPALRAAVASSIAAHLHYMREPKRRIVLAELSVDAAKEAANPEFIALSLMAMRNALSAPEALAARLQFGSERVEWADRMPRSAQRCLARGERVVDRYAAGDLEGAERDAEDIEQIAREIPVRSMLSFLPRWRSLRANGAGRFFEAESAARTAFELTQQAHDPNAFPNLTMQLGMVRFEQGRWDDLDAMLTASATWLEPYRTLAPAVRAVIARYDLLRGRRERALADYELLVSDQFLDGDPEPLVTCSWLACMVLQLGDAERAERIYERLSAFGDQFVIFNFAIVARGSFARYLGILAHAAGRLDEAEHHFEQAIAANERIGASLYAARARADLASLLAARSGPGDGARTTAERRAARAAFEGFGVRPLAQAPCV